MEHADDLHDFEKNAFLYYLFTMYHLKRYGLIHRRCAIPLPYVKLEPTYILHRTTCDTALPHHESMQRFHTK